MKQKEYSLSRSWNAAGTADACEMHAVGPVFLSDKNGQICDLYSRPYARVREACRPGLTSSPVFTERRLKMTERRDEGSVQACPPIFMNLPIPCLDKVAKTVDPWAPVASPTLPGLVLWQ